MGIETLIAGSLFATLAGTGVSTAASMSAAGHNKRIAELEMQTLEQQKKQMELQARRQQLEVIRNNQKVRSMSLTATNAQGAKFSSGLQGAYGQAQGQSGSNLLAIDQNLTIGRTLADINTDISAQRMALADDQTMSSFGQGLQSFGGSLMKVVPAYERLSTTFGFKGPYV